MEEKIEEYAKFLREVLRPNHDALLDIEANLRKDIADYKHLLESLNNIPDETEVDLGYRKVFCNATADDTRFIYVHIAMGFHAQLTILEAKAFVPRRVEFLENKLKQKNAKTHKLEQQIASSELILDQLSYEMKRED